MTTCSDVCRALVKANARWSRAKYMDTGEVGELVELAMKALKVADLAAAARNGGLVEEARTMCHRRSSE